VVKSTFLIIYLLSKQIYENKRFEDEYMKKLWEKIYKYYLSEVGKVKDTYISIYSMKNVNQIKMIIISNELNRVKKKLKVHGGKMINSYHCNYNFFKF